MNDQTPSLLDHLRAVEANKDLWAAFVVGSILLTALLVTLLG